MAGEDLYPPLTSGAMYKGVPAPAAVRVADVESHMDAMPKSAIFGVLGDVEESMRTFSGLISLWVIPALCTAMIPEAMWEPIRATSCGGRDPWDRMMSRRLRRRRSP